MAPKTAPDAPIAHGNIKSAFISLATIIFRFDIKFHALINYELR